MNQRSNCLPILITAFCILITASVAEATVFYVNPNGNDKWSGQLKRPNAAGTDGPLASLEGAKSAIRKLKSTNGFTEPVRVKIAAGRYEMTQPVVFEPFDSGTEKCPIIFEAANKSDRPVFDGGRRITGVQTNSQGLWTAHIPEVAGGKWFFEQVFVNGKWAKPARTPNNSYYYMAGPVKADEGSSCKDKDNPELSKCAFRADANDIRQLICLSKEQLGRVRLTIYHAWEISMHHIAAIDSNTNKVYLTGPAYWPLVAWWVPQRYYLENLRSALDEPGEWYVDADGTFLYKPRAGEDIATASVYAPAASQLIILAGDPNSGKYVEHIAFKGLNFRNTGFVLPLQGHSDDQAASTVDGVIRTDGAKHIAIKQCEISNIANYAVWFRSGCRDCSVEKTYMHDLGAGGVRIGQTVAAKDVVFETSHNKVNNNIISHGGLIFQGSVGVLIGQSSYNIISHNEIADLGYTGISAGWEWSYAASLAHHNTIEFNHIHHLGHAILSDMGGIYTLSVSPGTVIRNNVIHDISMYSYGAWGIYNDLSSSYCTIENNLIYNVQSDGILHKFGKGNIVRNNIFVMNVAAQAVCSIPLEEIGVKDANERSFIFEKNILYSAAGFLLGGNWDAPTIKSDRNIYWTAPGTKGNFADKDFDQRQKAGRDCNSIMADPLFIDFANYDFRLKKKSPAIKLGFVPFDPREAGIYDDAALFKIIRNSKFADEPFARLPIMPDMNENFETMQTGSVPTNFQIGGNVRVTDEKAATGKNSIKITNIPAPKESCCYLVPNYKQGTIQCSFDLYFEPGSEIIHNWNDYNPIATGPSFTISDGKLRVNKETLMELSAGQWIHFEISADVGDTAKRAWKLNIKHKDGRAKYENLRYSERNWHKLDWFGLTTSSKEKTTFYIDNLCLKLMPVGTK